MTQIVENARLEVLRRLAEWRDILPLLRKYCPSAPDAQRMDADCWPRDDAWENKWEDAVIAVRELAALGHITAEGIGSWEVEDWSIAITDAGYDWIKAHDAIGEAQQEVGGP